MKYVITQDIDKFSNFEEGLKFEKIWDETDVNYYESDNHRENQTYFIRNKINYTNVIKILDKE